MTPTRAFIRAWYNWRHSHLPTKNFHARRDNALTYGVELDLDHLHTRLYSLGTALIEGKTWDYAKFAAEELIVLNKIRLDLEDRDMPAKEMEPFRRYISVAHNLIMEMKDPFSANSAV
jgi:hypothetical protein